MHRSKMVEKYSSRISRENHLFSEATSHFPKWCAAISRDDDSVKRQLVASKDARLLGDKTVHSKGWPIVPRDDGYLVKMTGDSQRRLVIFKDDGCLLVQLVAFRDSGSPIKRWLYLFWETSVVFRHNKLYPLTPSSSPRWRSLKRQQVVSRDDVSVGVMSIPSQKQQIAPRDRRLLVRMTGVSRDD